MAQNLKKFWKRHGAVVCKRNHVVSTQCTNVKDKQTDRSRNGTWTVVVVVVVVNA